LPAAGRRSASLRRLLVVVQIFLLAASLIGPATTFAADPSTDPAATPAPSVEPPPDATAAPTAEPTAAPTAEPTPAPTAEPTAAPTAEPTAEATPDPTAAPTAEPTVAATAEPTSKAPPQTPPSISSDQADYVPGGLVTLTGTDWGPGESVHIYVNDDFGSSWSRNVDVVADADGRIADQFLLPEWFVAVYTVIAIDASGAQATATFTDGNVNIRTVGTATEPASIAWRRVGTAACTGGTVGSSPQSGTITAGLTGNGTAIPGGAGTGEFLRLTADPVPGYTFVNWTGGFGASTANPLCLPGDNSTQNIQVNYAAVTVASTSLGVASATGTFGGTVNLSATLTAGASGVSGKIISFGLNGSAVGTATTNASGVASLTGASLAGINAGTYAAGVSASFAGDSSYSSSNGTASLTVNKAAGSVTINNIPASATFGGSFTPTFTKLGDGAASAASLTSLKCTVSSGVVSYVGAGTCTLRASVTAGTNYNPATGADQSFTINQKSASVTPAANSKIYGAADPTLTGTLSGFLAADGVTASYSRTAGETVAGSPYTISATLSPAAVLANYDTTYNTANFAITPRMLAITPDASQSKIYGAADPVLSYSHGLLYNGDTDSIFTGALSRAAGETVAGGPYAINLGTLSAGSNYSISFTTGVSFAITPRAATWTTNPNSKILGSADPSPLTTGGGSNFLLADGVTATYSRAPGELVGGYHISATLGSSVADALANYTITNSGSTFSIVYASSGTCAGSPAHQVLQPVNANYLVDLSVFKQGSTVPVKFRVCDANGVSIGTPGVVTGFVLTSYSILPPGAVIDETVISTTPDTSFRWSSTDQQWIFNLNTKGLTKNVTYFYTITLNDGSTIEVHFGLK
jgi:hypothetical protein